MYVYEQAGIIRRKSGALVLVLIFFLRTSPRKPKKAHISALDTSSSGAVPATVVRRLLDWGGGSALRSFSGGRWGPQAISDARRGRANAERCGNPGQKRIVMSLDPCLFFLSTTMIQMACEGGLGKPL
ncbi:hypothetical protein LX36DRAFT_193488 [Colletotrichum falcatum]|nr:hypothetical protein LX36DRAFT_193488 [Colletotrichum falcatum]